jgi:hypothetical protein
MTSTYLAVAADPRIIPGVHHHCNEWCERCDLTNRCLAYRCTAEYRQARGRRNGDATFSNLTEAFAFTRELAAIEGATTAELHSRELDPRRDSEADDPLAALALEYTVRAAMLVGPGAIDAIGQPPRSPEGGATDVLAWYHLRVYGRVFRALIARRGGLDAREDEALGFAKLAIVSVCRSRAALRTLGETTDPIQAAELVSLLDAIERGLDERFPKARNFVRLGLDVSVA